MSSSSSSSSSAPLAPSLAPSSSPLAPTSSPSSSSGLQKQAGEQEDGGGAAVLGLLNSLGIVVGGGLAGYVGLLNKSKKVSAPAASFCCPPRAAGLKASWLLGGKPQGVSVESRGMSRSSTTHAKVHTGWQGFIKIQPPCCAIGS